MKVCTKCNILKDYSYFNKKAKSIDGYRSDCRHCRSKETLIYRIKNADKIKHDNNKFSVIRKEENKKYHSEWREKNRESIRDYQKKLYQKNLIQNREKRNIYVKVKAKKDPIYKLRNSVRTRIKLFLKSKNISENTNKLIGCDFITLKNHLELKFTDGMNWNNHGEWHIDHIKPLYSAKNKEDIFDLCHYTNLQPLWAKDNLIKGKVY